MKTTRFSLLLLAVAASALAPACGPESELEEAAAFPQEIETDTDKILKGTVNWTHPAVGELQFGNALCTGTLIAPHAVITAAHCVDYTSRTTVPTTGTYRFRVFDSSGNPLFTARLRGWVAYSSSLGKDDIAVVRLQDLVPSTVARPVGLATSSPWWGTRIDIWGFGCTNDSALTGYGDKRVRTLFWGGFKNVLCPGDSGGPGLNGDTTETIFAINSSYCEGWRCSDRFGNVPKWRDTILAQVKAWTP